MNYGQALELLKKGKRVAREGWNGKGMFVFLQKGMVNYDDYLAHRVKPDVAKELQNNTVGGVHIRLFDFADNGIINRMPCFVMKAADGSHVPGWLASQTDMLAEDWEEVE